MTPREKEMLERLRATYHVEATEYLQSMGAELLAIERSAPGTPDPRRLESIYRTAHSLKGASRSISAKDIELVCQALESVLSAWKKGTLPPDARALAAVHRAVDFLAGEIAALHAGTPPAAAPAVRAQVDALEALLGGTAPTAPAAPAAPPAVAPPRESGPALAPAGRADSTVRIAVAKVDRVLRSAEEMLAVKHVAAERRSRIGEIRTRIADWEREWARLQGAKRTLHEVWRHTGPGPAAAAMEETLNYLEWSAARLRELEKLIVASEFAASRESHTGGKLVDQLLDEAKQLLMLPVSTLTDPLVLQVRQLGRDTGKDVQLVVAGAEFEMDKRVLDELKDPLLHLVRNAVDHGIESAEVRARSGKPGTATLRLTVAAAEGARVRFTLSDDGGGIDLDRVKKVAVRLGALSAAQAEALTDREALDLIFLSDVSTNPIVTDLSGRGLGLAIVRDKVERLGGGITVETHAGRGTAFRLLVPVELAVLRGVVVEAAQQSFLLPLAVTERALRVAPAEVQLVQERPMIHVGDQAVPLHALASLLGLAPPVVGPTDVRRVVLLAVDGIRLALQVDDVLRTEEVLMKPLPPPLRHVRHVAGAATLAAGALVIVLNPYDLVRSARVVRGETGAPLPSASAPPFESAPIAVLVADDSITSRTLLKGILESAGYVVETAVNGLEALEKLRSGRFQLVVSDVEMPRMNGFDLTARIRSERRLAETPVVLVTALSSDEDRARGIEVGANAYVTKGEFDQSNLLEIVRRLA
jgi:two-component system chemotaxis sensor kinase CheA